MTITTKEQQRYSKQDLGDALDFYLFEGDFGAPFDIELSNKIVTSRGEYTCHICAGKISKGEILDWPPESPDNQYHLNK
ncbi:TPA: hypothetical protein ODM50_004361 [Escherichia coli]|nr:hypothetical protein [Escherichia coli]